MPSVRNKNKAIISCWVHKDIHKALGIVCSVSKQTVTRYVLEALAEKMKFSLDEDGNPVGLDLATLASDAFEQRPKPAPRRKE